MLNQDPKFDYHLKIRKWFWALLSVEVLTIVFFQIPTRLGFDATAFGDNGLSLNAQYLIQHNYRPGVDFGYPYGTLSLLFGNLSFGLFGLRPFTFFSAITICDLAFALGMARFAGVLRLRWPALVLIAVSIPFCILFDITLAHALERVFLVWALAFHADGHRSHALAFAAGAALVKPSMGFVYGFLLLPFILAALWQKSKLTAYFFAREVRWAALVATSVLFVSMAAYGTPATFRLSLPLTGAEIYRAGHFGFFTGAGRGFWYFPRVHLGYYFGTVVAFWFAASVGLIAGGCSSAFAVLASFRNREEPTPARELTLFCALMHVALVTLFFGNNASWTSYPYLLPMGVGTMTLWTNYTQKLVWLLIILGVVGQKGMIDQNFHAWFDTAPSTTTAGLWANRDERQEWAYVLNLSKDKSPVVLVFDGSAELLFTEMARPVVVTLVRGSTPSSELRRKIDQLSAAQIAIVPEVPNSLGFLNGWPEFKDKLSIWGRVVFRGRYFTVYQRFGSGAATESIRQPANPGFVDTPVRRHPAGMSLRTALANAAWRDTGPGRPDLT